MNRLQRASVIVSLVVLSLIIHALLCDWDWSKYSSSMVRLFRIGPLRLYAGPGLSRLTAVLGGVALPVILMALAAFVAMGMPTSEKEAWKKVVWPLHKKRVGQVAYIVSIIGLTLLLFYIVLSWVTKTPA